MSIMTNKRGFDQNGYALIPGLYSGEEVDLLLRHYMAMHERESAAENQDLNDTSTVSGADPLVKWPRLMQMHRRDATSLNWLLDPRLNHVLSDLMGISPYAVQTMMYFKPAGARGQALHQDNFYLRVSPGTCIAAWLALDDCDTENGCLQVVPGSHQWPILCTVPADTSTSFTDVTVALAEGHHAVNVPMKAGDVLFFNGQLVHGSLPNQTANRFRRSLIAHYIAGEAEQVYKWYKPALRFDGTEVDIGTSERGGTCGTWVTRNGAPVLEIVGEEPNDTILGRH